MIEKIKIARDNKEFSAAILADLSKAFGSSFCLNCEKLLGIYTDSNFSFEYHINRICRKASQKLHVLSRIAKYYYWLLSCLK